MKNKKYLVDEWAIRHSQETGKGFKYKTIPTDIDEERRGYGCTENASEVKTKNQRSQNEKEED